MVSKSDFIEKLFNDADFAELYPDKHLRRLEASKLYDRVSKELETEDRLNATIAEKVNSVVSAEVKKIELPHNGADGVTPVKNVDYFTDEDIKAIKDEVLKEIPAPQVTEKVINNHIEKQLTQVEVDEIAAYILSFVDLKSVKENIKKLEEKLNVPRQAIHTGGGAKVLNHLNDVQVTNPSAGDLLTYNATERRWTNTNNINNYLKLDASNDPITGQLNIEVPTATSKALVLKTTDDNTTKNILEVQSSSGSTTLSFLANGKKITSTSTDLTFEQTGDTLGTTSFTLLNRNGGNGVLFENKSIDLIDFQAKTSTGNVATYRYEHRVGRPEYLSGNTNEIQLFVAGLSWNVGGVLVGSKTRRLLMVSPSATSVPITVQAAATQTANLTEWQNSSGTKLAWVEDDGKIVSSNIGSSLSGDRADFIQYGDVAGNLMNLNRTFSGTTASGNYISLKSLINSGSLTGTASNITGIDFQVNSATTTVTTMTGYKTSLTFTGTGTVTNVYGVNVETAFNAAATVTALVGLHVNTINASASSATVTDAYGLKINNVSGATNNYAIYTNAGAVRLGDTVQTTGRKQAIATKSADYTLTTNDEVVVFTATATATLPAATGTGQTYRICNESSGGTVTIDGASTDTIKKELTQTLAEGEDLIITDYASGKWA